MTNSALHGFSQLASCCFMFVLQSEGDSVLQIILDVVHLTPDDLTTTASVIVWPAKLKPVVDRAVEVGCRWL